MKLPTHIGNTLIVATNDTHAYVEECGVRLKLPKFNPRLQADHTICIDGIHYSMDNSQTIQFVNEK